LAIIRLILFKKITDMKKIFIFVMLTAVISSLTACNDEWTEEQYEHFVSFSAPLNSKGVTNVYVPYSRKTSDGAYKKGEGMSDYQLPILVSGTLATDKDINVHVAFDPDTLNQLNYERFQSRTDLFYSDMEKYVSFPEVTTVHAGDRKAVLDVDFNFKGIDMSEKWVLPLTIVDGSQYGYQAHPRKNYKKALLRVFPFNDYSGDYSGTALLTTIDGDEGSGSLVKNDVRGYVVDENTIFFYAGTMDEERTDRKNYKIMAKFVGDNSGIVQFSCDNPEVDFKVAKEASFRITESMDAVRPYLKHRYLIINNIEYWYSDYTSVLGTAIRYHVKGTLTLERQINTQIPDEDQAIEW